VWTCIRGLGMLSSAAGLDMPRGAIRCRLVAGRELGPEVEGGFGGCRASAALPPKRVRP